MLVQLSISFVHVLLLIRDKISGHFSSSKFGFGLVVRGKKRSTFNFTDIKYHATMTMWCDDAVSIDDADDNCFEYSLLLLLLVVTLQTMQIRIFKIRILILFPTKCQRCGLLLTAQTAHWLMCDRVVFSLLLLLRASCDEWYFATELKSPHRISTNRMFVCSGLIIANIER